VGKKPTRVQFLLPAMWEETRVGPSAYSFRPAASPLSRLLFFLGLKREADCRVGTHLAFTVSDKPISFGADENELIGTSEFSHNGIHYALVLIGRDEGISKATSATICKSFRVAPDK
jgi:hypothetical protein